jgi:hypothetical protein
VCVSRGRPELLWLPARRHTGTTMPCCMPAGDGQARPITIATPKPETRIGVFCTRSTKTQDVRQRVAQTPMLMRSPMLASQQPHLSRPGFAATIKPATSVPDPNHPSPSYPEVGAAGSGPRASTVAAETERALQEGQVSWWPESIHCSRQSGWNACLPPIADDGACEYRVSKCVTALHARGAIEVVGERPRNPRRGQLFRAHACHMSMRESCFCAPALEGRQPLSFLKAARCVQRASVCVPLKRWLGDELNLLIQRVWQGTEKGMGG